MQVLGTLCKEKKTNEWVIARVTELWTELGGLCGDDEEKKFEILRA